MRVNFEYIPSGGHGRLTREQATECVSRHEFRIDQYRAVPRSLAKKLLGLRYELLLIDPIRNIGPTKETVYPWNVIDYLSEQYPRKR